MLSRIRYEQFVYALPIQFPSIRLSTLVVVPPMMNSAELTGLIAFHNDILYWYDSWPHPHLPELAATHPHHKHIHPDIKHHRVPAPHLQFDQPNLPFLIQEIEQELLNT